MYFQKTSSLLLQFLSPLWVQSQQREITRVLKVYQLCLLKEIKEMSVLLQFLFSTQQRKQKSSHLYPVFFLFLESMLLMHICNGKRRQGDQFKKILLSFCHLSVVLAVFSSHQSLSAVVMVFAYHQRLTVAEYFLRSDVLFICLKIIHCISHRDFCAINYSKNSPLL